MEADFRSGHRGIYDLFFSELDEMCHRITDGLLELERQPLHTKIIDDLIRIIHSLKGGARIVELPSMGHLCHSLEEGLIATKDGTLSLDPFFIDLLLQVVDAFQVLCKNKEEEDLEKKMGPLFYKLKEKSEVALKERPKGLQKPASKVTAEISEFPLSTRKTFRVTANHLDKLRGYAEEGIVEAKWLRLFGEILTNLKREQFQIASLFDKFREGFESGEKRPLLENILRELTYETNSFRQSLSDRISEYDLFEQRSYTLSERIYQEVLDIRMRPIGEGIQGLKRLVRDLSKTLQKEVELILTGEGTYLDREILDRLESPLNHLIRNAIDHGIEMPDERVAKGKPRIGTIHLKASKRSGNIEISIVDDGGGISFEKIREEIGKRKLIGEKKLASLQESDLLTFILQPGFSTKKTVSEISGRGVGLDAVSQTIKELGGHFEMMSQFGKGTTIQMSLPLTLSLLRALIVNVWNEPYAFSLSRIDKALRIPQDKIAYLEDIPYFTLQERRVPLIFLGELLNVGEKTSSSPLISIILFSLEGGLYGLIVDSFSEEKELVLQQIDPRLGKIPGVMGAAFLEDGSPLLILHPEEMIKKLLPNKRERALPQMKADQVKQKRILVVDDTATVREVEKRLLEGKHYLVETAVDGLEGWHLLRSGVYDLLITDINMPKMDGIELVKKVRSDGRFETLPILVISYRHRTEHKEEAINAGANRYLTKGTFDEDQFLRSVEELLNG